MEAVHRLHRKQPRRDVVRVGTSFFDLHFARSNSDQRGEETDAYFDA
jgi:hypothetical protein